MGVNINKTFVLFSKPDLLILSSSPGQFQVLLIHFHSNSVSLELDIKSIKSKSVLFWKDDYNLCAAAAAF